MTHVRAVEAFDAWLRLLMASDEPFGNKIIVFAGDFRQVLPVVPITEFKSVVRYTARTYAYGEKTRRFP